MAIDQEWTSVYPTGLDSNSSMPDLGDHTHNTRWSQWQALRNAVKELEAQVGSDSLESSSLRANRATTTTGVFHVYANGSTGNDSNSGLDVDHPKLTLQAVFNLIPDIVKHNTCVHLAGTFNEFGIVNFAKTREGYAGASTPIILIDGGDTTTVVDDNGGNHYTTIAGTSTSQLVVSGTPWTTDQRYGYWIKILTGPAAGEIRSIFKNVTDTIYPARYFTSAPGTGATFDIVRPTTTLSASSTTSYILLCNTTRPAVRIQRLYCSGSKVSFYSLGNLDLCLSSLVLNTTASSAWSATSDVSIAVQVNVYNNSSFVLDTSNKTGVSVPGSSTLDFSGCGRVNLPMLLSRNVELAGCGFSNLWQGSRIRGKLTLTDCANGCGEGTPQFQNTTSPGCQVTTVGDSSGVGVLLKNTRVTIHNINISNNTSHGIEAVKSHVEFTGACTGSGNGGAGVYAHSGSVVHIKHGAAPTLTGTVGDLAVSSPTAQESTWAAIDAGTPVAIAAEMTMAKEVV